MKRNDWKIILGAGAYTYLFYQQLLGLNTLVFAILISVLLFLNQRKNFTKPTVALSLLGTILSAICIYLFGSSLPIISFILSIALLSALVFEPSSSFIVAAIHGLFSPVLSIPNFINQLFTPRERTTGEQTLWRKLFLLSFPFILTLIFFFLYRAANPNFLELTKSIHFDWLSFPLVRFFLIGLVVLYALLGKHIIEFLQTKDKQRSDEISIQDEETHKQSFWGKRLNLKSEWFIGISLFIMLNLLLGIVNTLDIVQLWPNRTLPENLDSYSQYVHHGIQMLIISIVLAISIILFFFRGVSNYVANTKWMKTLAYLWIAQNITLLISTAMRNMMYVEVYGLSHKRIGVFIYLLLSVIGLIFTGIKLFQKKNSAFLVRQNAWAFYVVMLICTAIPWDNIITNYNIALAQAQNKKPDVIYLASLSDMNTSKLLPYLDTTPIDFFESDGMSIDSNYQLNRHFIELMHKMTHTDWQSSCVSRTREFNAMLTSHEEDKALSQIVLNDNSIAISSLHPLRHLKALAINGYNSERNWSSLQAFEELETLNLQNLYTIELDSLPKLEQLKDLNLKNNGLYGIKGLSLFPNLQRLDLRNNSIADYSPLYRMSSLQELYLDDIAQEIKDELALRLPNTRIIYSRADAYSKY